MKKDPRIFIAHILECIEHIEDYISDMTEETFSKTPQLQDAVIRRIEVMGEAVKNLPPAIKMKYPDIPWKEIAGMRDILIHGYFGVDLALTWRIARKDVPSLKKKILKIKRNLEDESS